MAVGFGALGVASVAITVCRALVGVVALVLDIGNVQRGPGAIQMRHLFGQSTAQFLLRIQPSEPLHIQAPRLL